MPNRIALSEVKSALLRKYLSGSLPQTAADTISRRVSGGYAPLSFQQQQVWFLAQLLPNIPVYNECVSIHLPGPLDVAALEQALNEFIRRHEAWRTTFPTVDGLPVQMIQPSSPLKLPVVDLRHLLEAEREAEALRLATEDAGIIFDLAHGPLLRAILICLGEEEHRLFLTLHHILFDGVAIYQVFLPELHTLYQAFSADQSSPLPELPIQYADFAIWQRQWLKEDVLTSQLAYWKQQLAGAPTVLELPADRPRPSVRSYHGSMQSFALSKRLTDDLRILSYREGSTLYTILVAAFKTLLYRYTGQCDLVIGTATAGRKRPEIHSMMGFFLNTLVLRTDLSGNPTFSELLRRVQEVIFEAVAHENVPFEYLIKELRPERSSGQNPLFQILLTLEPPQPILVSGWTLTHMDIAAGTSKFDLSLELDDRPEGLLGRFEYNTDLFDAQTIARMVGHWQMLLEGIVADPRQRLSKLPILTLAERHLLLVDWNAIATTHPQDQCVHLLFETQVERTPDAVALVFEEQQLTYRQLNVQANQLAHHLRQLGVEPEVVVGLCMERSVEMVVGLLGILKAGGAYVPLDPSFPSERLAFMLEDAQVPVLVTQQYLLTQLPRHATHVVCLDADKTVLAQHSQTNPVPGPSSDNLAYVIYTSGSTGRPKGVQILHRSLVNFLLSMRQQPGLASDDTWLAVTTLSFDIAALELFLPLIVGARLIVASYDVVTNATVLAQALTRSRATVMQATPVTWRMLLAAGWQGNAGLKILCGGEALPLELGQQLLPKGRALWNLYGPTETTVWSTVCRITAEDKVVTIGRPIAHTQIYILDDQVQLVPIGVPGELYLGGEGLARGYLNRPELTAERFIPHPFSHELNARLYKTGDLARYRADGTIEHLGRLDHQVKLRGFRIELGEIEAMLSQHPVVRQAVVVMREDKPGEKRLVAYLVLHQGQAVTIAELQEQAMNHLPNYMVPSAFVLLETLPLTPNNKVDRRALPIPDQVHPERQLTFVAPRTPLEEMIADIWSQVLGLEQVGIHDNFFALGGHSLLAMQVIALLHAATQVELPLRSFFEAPTVAQLAESFSQLQTSGVKSDMPALRPISRQAHRMSLTRTSDTSSN